MVYKRPIVAFAYDFDGTLAPGNMQEHAFLPALGITASQFWAEVKSLAQEQQGDEIHAYMHLMLQKANAAGLDLTEAAWRQHGADLSFFPGVRDWFHRQNERAANLELDLRHFVISSGNREMVLGSKIGAEFEKVYASAFIYNAAGVATGVALAVSYTGKTQYLFRINKWTLEEWDDRTINAPVAMDERPVPFDRIVFFGDGLTDVPTMRLVTDHGGFAVAVYDPTIEKSRAAARSLRAAGRARFAGPADYREGSSLDEQAGAMLVEMSARVHAQNLVSWPAEEAG
jgi:hypothetical protein